MLPIPFEGGEILDKKRHFFEIQLNSIEDSDNPTKADVSFILHGFDISHNYAFIAKETAEGKLHTLKGMPIVARYHSKSSFTANDDALGSHEMYLDKDRDTGEEIIALDTVPIGVFTEDAYITTIQDSNGEEKEVVAGKGILWASRFPNVVGLLKEWVDEGINVVSSMEILYDSYKVEEGITEILNYVYEGHCILNSEDRGSHRKIKPAYDESKLTKLVAQAIEIENKQMSSEEVENMEKFRKVFELSHSDVRTLIYNQFNPTLGQEEDAWIAEVYDTYFIVNHYSWAEDNSFDKYYKIEYTKNDDVVQLNMDSKAEVFLKRNWEEVAPEEMQTQLNEKEEKITELTNQLNEFSTNIETLTSEKEEIERQFNEASEKLVQLNSQVDELTPFKEQVETETFEKALNEKKEFYQTKFRALNATEKFEDEEIQNLVKLSVSETDEGKQATLQLNSMLVDLVVVQKEKQEDSTFVREVASKRENLIPASNDFDTRYSL